MHQDFKVDGAVEAAVRLGSGTLSVQPTDPGVVWAGVAATDATHEPSVRLAERALIVLRGDQLKVDVPESGRVLRRASVAVTLGLPPGSSLAVKGGAVDISVVGGLEAFAAKLGAGDVVVDSATDVAVRSGQSDLIVGRAETVAFTTGQGALRADTVGDTAFKAGQGSVELGRTEGAVAVKGGAVQLVVQEACDGEVDFHTGSGGARIGVRAGTTVELDLMSASGDVRCDLPMESSAPSGGAALRLRLRTGSGDLLVQPAMTDRVPSAGA
jgi:DUF4097 and DUF4098 domain-containing protein YvlB